MRKPKCPICHDTGRKHDPYCELGACNVMCVPCPNGCPVKVFTPNGEEVTSGPAIVRRQKEAAR